MRRIQPFFPLKLSGRLTALVLCACLGACRVSPPTIEQVRDVGFDSPVQAFQSFTVAVRADWPGEEYRCFSRGFKQRNGLSRLGYLEFRDELKRRQPLLRWALGKASRHPENYVIETLRPNKWVRLSAETAGRKLVVTLVREDYLAVHGQPQDPLLPAEIWIDEPVDDLVVDGHLAAIEQRDAWVALVPDPGRDMDEMISLQVGREWKIDDIYVEEKGKSQTLAAQP